ncbi:MAG: toprim domain-containing protein [Actinobacteria bacterium]|nr:toprim domain-containing protein [Actinomycetota bacterium]
MATQRVERHHWPINDVLERTDLAALLDELTQPSGRMGPGRKWHCPMPYHDDHRASVTMFRDRHGHERWRCWSGDHRGDAIDLAVAATGQDRGEAVDWLAARAGMFPHRPLPAIKPKASPAPDTAKMMDPLVARYVHACARVLTSSTGRPVRDWLHGRGIGDQTVDANLIGADPGREMMRRGRGLPYGSGLAATFPVFGPAGNLTYVQARYLGVEAAGRKYDNPAAALAPHPRLGFAVSPNLLHPDTLLVCEGMPDALIAAQAGFHAVGLLGAQTPDEAVAARLANRAEHLDGRIVLVCDPDPAGRRVAEALSPLLVAQGHVPTVITPPDGCDLNDWAKADIGWAGRLISQLSVSSDVALQPRWTTTISNEVAL